MTFVKKLLACLPLCCFCLMPLRLDAKQETLPEAEINISRLFTRLAGLSGDQAKKSLADTISRMMHAVLEMPGTFDFPFEQLVKIGKIKSPDGKIRIYTWNIPWSDGSNTYYGFLQSWKDNKKDILLTALEDRSDEITDPGNSVLSPDRWYGMLVYEIVVTQFDQRTFYTLLGYDNESLFLSSKIADVLYFSETGVPVFGKAIFHYNNLFLCRLLFHYSARVQMSMKWNAKLNLIVFDHLSPVNPSYTGNYQYYGPDFSFDGLRFVKGTWEWIQNVDVRGKD